MSPSRTVLICACLAALGPLSMSLYTPAMPLMVEALRTEPSLIKFTLTVYLLGFAGGQLLVGGLSDMHGRRPIGLVFLGLYLAGTLICLSAARADVLLVGRLIQGIGASAGVVLSRALVRDQFEGQEAARLFNLTSLILISAPAVAPLMGGVSVQLWGWRSVFVLMTTLWVSGFSVVVLAMRETRPDTDAASSLRSAAASYGQLLADRSFVYPSIAVGSVTGGVYTLSALLPFIMLHEFGLSPAAYGASMLAQAGSFGLGALVVSKMIKRVSSHAISGMGVALVGCAALGFALLVSVIPATPVSLMSCLAVWAFGNALINPGFIARALQHTGARAGAASALIGFMQIGSGFVGSLVAASLFGQSLDAVRVLMPLAAVISIYAAVMTSRDTRCTTGIRGSQGAKT